MRLTGAVNLSSLLSAFRWKVALTWLLVLLENLLLALIPLFIGFSIDGLLAGNFDQLLILAAVLMALTVVAVGRRFYDTRAYGAMRMALGASVDGKQRQLPVSLRTARLDMARELVDFLERDVPEAMTAVIQVLVTLVVLASFDMRLAQSALFLIGAMLLLYGVFHNRFLLLNGALNNQLEQQVSALKNGRGRLWQHLKQLRCCEVKLSDTEALLYGGIFLLITAFVILNLWLCSLLPDLTAGSIFSIVSYSWEFAEAAILLPMTLQAMSRLSEISHRLNNVQAQV